jgi:hypothetical protein
MDVYEDDLDTEMCANCGDDYTDHCPYCHGCGGHTQDCDR